MKNSLPLLTGRDVYSSVLSTPRLFRATLASEKLLLMISTTYHTYMEATIPKASQNGIKAERQRTGSQEEKMRSVICWW
jgi:hypothetical protein